MANDKVVGLGPSEVALDLHHVVLGACGIQCARPAHLVNLLFHGGIVEISLQVASSRKVVEGTEQCGPSVRRQSRYALHKRSGDSTQNGFVGRVGRSKVVLDNERDEVGGSHGDSITWNGQWPG